MYFGFHPRKGDLRAVKVWNLKREHKSRPVIREIELHLSFTERGDTEGIVETFAWFNSLGHSSLFDTDCANSPRDYHMVMEQGKPFNRAFQDPVQSQSPDPWNDKKCLFRQLLLGLKAIHRQNLIHGDITPQNLIFIAAYPGSPSKAKIIDFGKAQEGPRGLNYGLAAAQYQAPEVREGRPFDFKIDVWGLSLSLAIVWFRVTVNAMNDSVHHHVLSVLEQASLFVDFAALLKLMLQEDAVRRPDAVECLNHACFR